MSLWIVVVVLIVLALAAGMAVFALRRSPSPPPPPVVVPEEEDPAVRRARHQVLEERGTELLERRVELDAKRGTLVGDSVVYDAFEALEDRLRAGEITPDEFEREKIRILSGG